MYNNVRIRIRLPARELKMHKNVGIRIALVLRHQKIFTPALKVVCPLRKSKDWVFWWCTCSRRSHSFEGDLQESKVGHFLVIQGFSQEKLFSSRFAGEDWSAASKAWLSPLPVRNIRLQLEFTEIHRETIPPQRELYLFPSLFAQKIVPFFGDKLCTPVTKSVWNIRLRFH